LKVDSSTGPVEQIATVLQLENPVSGPRLNDVPAQIDSAADRTLIPDSVVQAPGLPQPGIVLIGGVGGVQQNLPTCPLQLAIHNFPPLTIEVVASGGESWVLLGRDVLNAYRISLDGPQLAMEISWHPTLSSRTLYSDATP
jgi:hypothetical protein